LFITVPAGPAFSCVCLDERERGERRREKNAAIFPIVASPAGLTMFWRKLGRPPLVAAAAAAADRARCHRAPSASAMAAAMMLLQCRRHLSASAGPLQPPPAPVAFAPPRTLPLDHERERLRKAVETIQSKAEARIYLSQFAEVTSRKFAIVAVESKLSEDELNELVSGLSILHKYGLVPFLLYVIFFFFPPLDLACFRSSCTATASGRTTTGPHPQRNHCSYSHRHIINK